MLGTPRYSDSNVKENLTNSTADKQLIRNVVNTRVVPDKTQSKYFVSPSKHSILKKPVVDNAALDNQVEIIGHALVVATQ